MTNLRHIFFNFFWRLNLVESSFFSHKNEKKKNNKKNKSLTGGYISRQGLWTCYRKTICCDTFDLYESVWHILVTACTFLCMFYPINYIPLKYLFNKLAWFHLLACFYQQSGKQCRSWSVGLDLHCFQNNIYPGLACWELIYTVKPVLRGHLKIDKIMVLMENGSLMKVKSIAECSKGSILQYFWPA